MMKTKPDPPPGLPTVSQRIASIKLAARSHQEQQHQKAGDGDKAPTSSSRKRSQRAKSLLKGRMIVLPHDEYYMNGNMGGEDESPYAYPIPSSITFPTASNEIATLPSYDSLTICPTVERPIKAKPSFRCRFPFRRKKWI